MKIKEGENVIIRKTGQAGVVTRILPNPYFPKWLCSPNYLVNIDKDNTGPSVFTKKQLIKAKKAVLLIMLLLVFSSCKTYSVYLIETMPEPVYYGSAKTPANRYTSSFHEADSLFQKASKEAAKAAYDKTKHLIPN